MSCMVTLGPLPQSAPLVRNMSSRKGDGRHLSFLSACGHKTTRERHHGTSTNDTVVTSRHSTVLLSNLVHENGRCQRIRAVFLTEHDRWRQTKSRMLSHPCSLTDAANVGLHPIWHGEQRVRHQRYPMAPPQPEKDE